MRFDAALQAELQQLLRTGQSKKAETILRNVIAHTPACIAAYVALASLLTDTARPALAEDILRQALARDADNAQVRRKLGVALRRQLKTDEARAQFTLVLQNNANDANALFQLGLLAYEEHRYDTAYEHLTRCVGIAPQHVEAWLVRGKTAQALGQLDDAIESYRRAVAINSAVYYRVAKNLVSGAHGVFWLRGSRLRETLGLTT